MKHAPEKSKFRPGERSFTLLETMAAMTLMVTVMLHVAGAQGGIIYNSDYGRRMTQAMWLAKSVMSKVEYYWSYQDLKKLETDGKVDRAKFTELQLPEDTDYTYSLKIQEWKFPFLELLQKGIGKKDSDEEDGKPEFPIRDMLKQYLGDDILKVAQVEVFWPEGMGKDNSVRLTYLLPNQRAVDDQIQKLTPAYEALQQHIRNEGKPDPTNDKECAERDPKTPKFDPESKKCVK